AADFENGKEDGGCSGNLLMRCRCLYSELGWDVEESTANADGDLVSDDRPCRRVFIAVSKHDAASGR
nr:hypothetical protein [Tanacetum cinerariifolium]